MLSPRAARILVEHLKHTKFTQFFGATETGLWPLYRLGPEDMDYLSFDACHMGAELRQVSGDGESLQANDGANPSASKLCEAVIVRSRSQTSSFPQATFETFPHLDEYATGDLFAPHPTRPHTWKYAGRTDDLILFGHGIKFHPVALESMMQQGHDRIRDVLLLGDRHQQAVLLIELTDPGLKDMENEADKATLRGEVDSLIDEVNETAPVIARIAKTHVLFASREKSLPRTSKGSVRRKGAAKLFQPEIDEVYRTYGDEMGRMMARVR